MTNSTIIDTDILIDAGRGVLDAVNCLQSLKVTSGLAISVVTQMELMVGCANKAELKTLKLIAISIKKLPYLKLAIAKIYLATQPGRVVFENK